jgi:endogenous inhibitor of DNA gyrase (YacG/DUF329 family)
MAGRPAHSPISRKDRMSNRTDESPPPAFRNDPRLIICIRACANCGTEFPVARKHPKQRYCSRKCGLLDTLPADHNARVSRESREKRGQTQRGRGTGKSYRKLLGRHEHRVVAEITLGRPLVRGEIVHHLDASRTNNAPSNLDVIADQAKHARLHMTGRKQSAEHVRKRLESRARTMAARSRE